MKLKKFNILFKETMGGYEEPSAKDRLVQYETSEFKNQLDASKNEILEQLGDNKNILQKINNLLKADLGTEELNILNFVKLQDFQEELYCSTDRLQHTVGLILETRIRQYDNPQELIDDISTVLNEEKLPRMTKILFIKSLKQDDFNLEGTDSIIVLNYILGSHPQYGKLFDDYISDTIDPQDGEIASTNMF